MSQEEQTLYEFLQTYSVHLDWPRKPPSDLPVESSIVFRPERVKQIPSRIAALDVDKGLEWYGSIWGDSYWTKDRVSTHLKKVVAFWGDAATRGDALLHTEF